jgi:hypothetical protein
VTGDGTGWSPGWPSSGCCCGAGLVATFADQATQDPRTRQELGEVLDVLGFPQVVLRLGHPLVDVPPTPRRPLEELLT